MFYLDNSPFISGRVGLTDIPVRWECFYYIHYIRTYSMYLRILVITVYSSVESARSIAKELFVKWILMTAEEQGVGSRYIQYSRRIGMHALSLIHI